VQEEKSRPAHFIDLLLYYSICMSTLASLLISVLYMALDIFNYT